MSCGNKIFYEKAEDVHFGLLTEFFAKLEGLGQIGSRKRAVGQKSNYKKKFEMFEILRNMVSTEATDLYQLYRLIIPEYDSERNYGLKEAKLASAFVQACNLSPDDESAQAAKNWKNNEIKNAGLFSEVMNEYIFKNHCNVGVLRGETVGCINRKLDELVIVDNLEAKSRILRWLIMKCRAEDMRWITRIILKDMKLHTSGDTVLRYFHKDALDLYNKTMSLRKVCTELRDPQYRAPVFGIQTGMPVSPQLAQRASSPEDAFKRFQHAKCEEFVIETKFDGERVQLHVNLTDNYSGTQTQTQNQQQNNISQINYFSRAGIDHGTSVAGYSVMNSVVRRQMLEQQCILDGEFIVFNKTKKQFEAFGFLKTVTQAAKMGKDTSEVLQFEGNDEGLSVGDVEIVYIVFDVLYVGKEGGSVINRSLRERHDLIRQLIRPAPEDGYPIGAGKIRGRIVMLLPDEPVIQGMVLSKKGSTLEELKSMFEEAVERQEEGIVVKDLESQWKIGERTRVSWMKIKPDYIYNMEVDALIIGGFYGSGRRRGGVLSEYLLALADKPPGHFKPFQFVSFCRVGTGVSDAQRKELEERLAPVLENRSYPPKVYKTTGHATERVSHWIVDPYKSVVVQVKADIRAIKSKVYATEYSLRFPRIERIRYDKAANDVTSTQELEQIIRDNQGSLVNFQEASKANQKSPKSNKTIRQGRMVVSGFKPSKTSKSLQSLHLLPEKTAIVFINYDPIGKNKAEEYAFLVGAKVWMNDVNRGEIVIAGEPRSTKFEHNLKVEKYSVIKMQWLIDCVNKQQVLPLLPRYYWFKVRREKQRSILEDFDERENRKDRKQKGAVVFDSVGDSLFYYLNTEDVKSILTRYKLQEIASYNVDSSEKLQGFDAFENALSALEDQGSIRPLQRACVLIVEYKQYAQNQYGILDQVQLLQNKFLSQTLQGKVAQVKYAIRKLGGYVCKDSSEQLLTHVILVTDDQLNQPSQLVIKGENVLDYIRKLGNIQTGFKRRVINGIIKFVHSNWVEQCHNLNQKLNENDYFVQFDFESFDCWPWKQYGVDSEEEELQKEAAQKRIDKIYGIKSPQKRKRVTEKSDLSGKKQRVGRKQVRKRSTVRTRKPRKKSVSDDINLDDFYDDEQEQQHSDDKYESDFIDDNDVDEMNKEQLSSDDDYVVQDNQLMEATKKLRPRRIKRGRKIKQVQQAPDYLEFDNLQQESDGPRKDDNQEIKPAGVKYVIQDSEDNDEEFLNIFDNQTIKSQNVLPMQQQKQQKKQSKQEGIFDSLFSSVIGEVSDSDGEQQLDQRDSPYFSSKYNEQEDDPGRQQLSPLQRDKDDSSKKNQSNNFSQVSSKQQLKDISKQEDLSQSKNVSAASGDDFLKRLETIQQQLNKGKQDSNIHISLGNTKDRANQQCPTVSQDDKQDKCKSNEGQKKKRSFADRVSGLLD